MITRSDFGFAGNRQASVPASHAAILLIPLFDRRRMIVHPQAAKRWIGAGSSFQPCTFTVTWCPVSLSRSAAPAHKASLPPHGAWSRREMNVKEAAGPTGDGLVPTSRARGVGELK